MSFVKQIFSEIIIVLASCWLNCFVVIGYTAHICVPGMANIEIVCTLSAKKEDRDKGQCVAPRDIF